MLRELQDEPTGLEEVDDAFEPRTSSPSGAS
jgi:hypothetical protein